MRLVTVPDHDYQRRIQRVQEELARDDLDLLVAYACECESASTRYLADFGPFFDFAGVLVPREGEAVLLTGGPESLEFARSFSRIKNIRVHPAFVETSAPDWVPQVEGENFSQILPEVLAGRSPGRIGVANWNIFPHVIFEDLRAAAPQAEFVPADELLLRVRTIKSEAEIAVIEEAYRITEQALIEAFEFAQAGVAEWEIEAKARSVMYSLGAENTSYPVWVCSGPNTRQSLCRSTDRKLQPGDLVQLTFGAKYMGYCGNMCRPFALGTPPEPARKLMSVALEAVHYALETIKPGVRSSDVFNGYHAILAKYGYEEFTLYGPAHGTGTSEVEGLWLAEKSDFLIQPNMVFNVDIWLSDGEYGLRYEDGIVVTETGIRELTSYRREIITK